MSTDERTPFPPCPRCAGEHLRDLTWRHSTTCDLYERDSATAAADFDRGRGIRPLTPTEAELVADEFRQPAEGWALAVRFEHRGIHRREVVEQPATGGYLATPASRKTTNDDKEKN